MCVNIGKPVNTNATRGDRCHEFMKHWEKELGSHAPIKRKNDERPQKAKAYEKDVGNLSLYDFIYKPY